MRLAGVLLGLLTLSVYGYGAGCTRAATHGPLQRGTVFVQIEETLDGESTDFNISQLLLERRLLHHGFALAPEARSARYLLEGKVEARFYRQHTFDYQGASQHLEYQFEGTAHLTLTDTQASAGEGEARTEEFQSAAPEIYGRTDMDDAKRDIRRKVATDISLQVVSGRLLGDAEARGLLDALADSLEQRSVGTLVNSMVARGSRMMPLLLDALEDDRPVRAPGSIPRVGAEQRDLLRIRHVADLALERITGRYSGLGVTSSEDLELAVKLGWTWHWEDVQRIPASHRVASSKRADALPAPAHGDPEPDWLSP